MCDHALKSSQGRSLQTLHKVLQYNISGLKSAGAAHKRKKLTLLSRDKKDFRKEVTPEVTIEEGVQFSQQ